MDEIMNASVYRRVVNAVLLNRYDQHNLMELINGILFLLKMDESHKETLARFVKEKVNRVIRHQIENIHDIYDILLRLIRIMNINTQINRNNRNRNNTNRNTN